ncbi:MAG TPA: hypothetical protein VLZ76_11235 [Lysobacter sp.]|nr:hypothetical protein [Lysobacter sp.]
MRHRTFHLWMNRLALAAVLALLLVPTTGRMAGMAGMAPMLPGVMSSDVMPSMPLSGLVSSATATMAGHPPASDVAAPTATGGIAAVYPSSPQSPNPGPHDNMAGDCEYCLLLQTMTPPSAWIALAAPSAQAQAPMALALQPRRGQRHPTGLGSRGPPHAA